MIDMAKRCKVCKGKKVKRENKTLSVEVDKGSPDGEQFTLHGEGDCVPDVEPGDLIAVIKIKEHKLFKRKGADLLIEKEISLLDALTGIDMTITHLDGRQVRIQNDKGEIIQPNQMMCCEGLGMPFHKTPYKYGNLFIVFKIKFPDQLNEQQMSQVGEVLKS